MEYSTADLTYTRTHLMRTLMFDADKGQMKSAAPNCLSCIFLSLSCSRIQTHRFEQISWPAAVMTRHEKILILLWDYNIWIKFLVQHCASLALLLLKPQRNILFFLLSCRQADENKICQTAIQKLIYEKSLRLGQEMKVKFFPLVLLLSSNVVSPSEKDRNED